MMTDKQFDELIRSALERDGTEMQVDDAAAARVMTRLAKPLPRQTFAFRRLPAILLDWQFAPAWPRMAALASCAAIGFLVGIAGLDRTFDRADAAYTLSLLDEADGITGIGP
jgi:hypothetical protein